MIYLKIVVIDIIINQNILCFFKTTFMDYYHQYLLKLK